MMFSNQLGFKNTVQEQIDNILDEFDKPYNEGMKLFANHSDCDGEFTPDECVLVWYRESYEVWQKMLIYAIENDQSILFLVK